MPLELKSYQEEGARFLASRRHAGLFDDMGLGKTAQTIRALDLVHAKKVLVICPAAVGQVWVGEFEKFAQIKRVVKRGTSTHDFYGWARGLYDVLIVSYEMASKWSGLIATECVLMDACVIDESHYLKSPTAVRTQKILGPDAAGDGLVKWAHHVWHLSGTPMPNDPIDIHTFLFSSGATPLNRGEFVREYFEAKPKALSVAYEVKEDKIPELRDLLGKMSVRRTLATAGLQLPEIFITDATLDGDTSEVKRLLAQYPGLDQLIIKVIESGKGLSGLTMDMANHVATLRRLIGEAKALPYAKLLVEELKATSEKFVVFGLHKRAIAIAMDFVQSHGFRCVSVTGDVKEVDRVANVTDFQHNPDCRVFFGNIRAAGVGLTLTSARFLDMLESDWTPAGNAQAIKRVHRISQNRSVRARFITLANSFDETVNKIVEEKTERIAAVDDIAGQYAKPTADAA
jgi:SWI/SNF-related matrix-associated actin-dependent regulator 1 of chromatin subfamily A